MSKSGSYVCYQLPFLLYYLVFDFKKTNKNL